MKCNTTPCWADATSRVHWVTGPLDVCDRCTQKFKNISEVLGVHTLVERLDVADLREFYDASLKEKANEPG